MAKKDKQVDLEDYLAEKGVDENTGEILPAPELNKVITTERRRKDGSLEYSLDFSNCPTLTEQHNAQMTDLNYLIEKFKPDELAAYMASKNASRPEITGEDFSTVPEGTAKNNIIYKLKQAFQSLDEDVRKQFSSHIEFIKFIDNPANAEKMIRLGLMTKYQVQQNQTPQTQTNNQTPPPLNPTNTPPVSAPQGAK